MECINFTKNQFEYFRKSFRYYRQDEIIGMKILTSNLTKDIYIIRLNKKGKKLRNIVEEMFINKNPIL